MMRYYSRTIYQFQFQKVLCDACGHTGPLYECDIYQCQAAGDKLKILLKQVNITILPIDAKLLAI